MKILVSICLVIINASSFAIVNVERMRIGVDRLGFSSNGSLNASGNAGNTEKLALDFGIRLQWQQQALSRFIVANYTYGESRDVRDSNKAFVHGRWVKIYRNNRAWEAFAQGSKDEFARLSFRGLAGGGLRYAWPNNAQSRNLILGIGGFYETESLEGAAVEARHTDEAFRLNSYIVYKIRLNLQTHINFLQYYQPAIDEFDDFRLLSKAALFVKAGEHFNIKLGVDLARDNIPPLGIKKTDIGYSSGVVIDF